MLILCLLLSKNKIETELFFIPSPAHYEVKCMSAFCISFDGWPVTTTLHCDCCQAQLSTPLNLTNCLLQYRHFYYVAYTNQHHHHHQIVLSSLFAMGQANKLYKGFIYSLPSSSQHIDNPSYYNFTQYK